MSAARFEIQSIDLFERGVTLRMPFRFGIVTLTEAPQAFVRARARLADGRIGEGMAAELLAPKWFDKNPALSNEDNFDQLRLALGLARERYLGGGAQTAFGHFALHYRTQIATGAERGLNSLVANYGPALIDRALLDALCRATGQTFAGAVRANQIGLEAGDLCPDLDGFDLPAFLGSLQPASMLQARHTVGLVDPIHAADVTARVNDGLPETLEEVVQVYRQRWFKLKVAGDIDADVDRLCRIAEVLDTIDGGYQATLDGNEQYRDVDGVIALWQRMLAEPRLAQLCDSVVLIEQPIQRGAALAHDVTALSALKPVIIDESDDSLDAFVKARDMGYRGVSSKTCKGMYKSILNAARCRHWNQQAGTSRFVMSAEDLTIQAGLALQQDLALVGLLGITHVERNGHHYVNGMADLPAAEQDAFLAAHPDLYHRVHGAVRVRIDAGALQIGSLDCVGFGSAAAPQWTAMSSMSVPA